jgi:Mu-like prophage I protein
MDPVRIREALGLSPDATDEEVLTAAAGRRQEAESTTPTPTEQPTTEPVTASNGAQSPVAASGVGVVAVDQSVLAELQRQAQRGEEAYAAMQANRRDEVIAAAIREGKFAPSRKTHWEALWKADPVGTENQILDLAPNLVPVHASGYPGDETYQEQEKYYTLYPEERPK